MDLSASAILLGLSVLKQGHLQPRDLADSFADLRKSSERDQVLGLQERILRDNSQLKPRLTTLSVQADYMPVHCPECGSRFRAYSWQIDRSDTCPVCNAPLTARRMAVLHTNSNRPARKAAEAEPAYHTAGSSRRFAHFELLSRVGSGGAGTVYEALNNRNQRRVALKLLKFLPMERTKATWERLLREAAVTSSVAGPHVVEVYDTALIEGRPYVEMEFLPGGSLRDRINRDGPIEPAQACKTLSQVLSGLATAHRENVIHRDLKPDNILLGEDGRAKVSDFGLCKLIEQTPSTTTGTLIGSPHFMAPEQWQSAEIGPWTDIYATGLVLYYVLTGHMPFDGDNALSVMYQHLHSPTPDPREWAPDTPPELCRILEKATAKDPADRFDSAEEFRESLPIFS